MKALSGYYIVIGEPDDFESGSFRHSKAFPTNDEVYSFAKEVADDSYTEIGDDPVSILQVVGTWTPPTDKGLINKL